MHIETVLVHDYKLLRKLMKRMLFKNLEESLERKGKMKKWVIICLTLFVSFILVACNSNSWETVTLQTEENGVIVKLTYKAKGDKVTEQTADNVIPYESLGITTPEEAEELFAELAAGFEGIEGVTHKMDYQDDQVVESLTIDYEKADLNEVGGLTGSMSDGDLSKGVSLKKSVEMLEEQGYEIVEESE